MLNGRVIPRVLRISRVRYALPGREGIVGVEAELPRRDARRRRPVRGLLAGADISVVAQGCGEPVVLGAVGGVHVRRLRVDRRVGVQGLKLVEVVFVEGRGDVIEVIEKLLIGLKLILDVQLGFVHDVGCDRGYVEEGPVVTRLGPEFLKERSALGGLEWPG